MPARLERPDLLGLQQPSRGNPGPRARPGRTRNRRRCAPARPCSLLLVGGYTADNQRPPPGHSARRRDRMPGRPDHAMPGLPWAHDAGTVSTRRGYHVAGNLTREEARQRAALLDVESYQVELDLTGHSGGALTFGSVTVVRFRCSSPGAATFIDLSAPAVTEITLNGAPLEGAAFDGDRIQLTGLAAENELRVAAECAYSRHGEGLHRFTDPADGGVYLYSDLETFDAHEVYACFDQPDLKATFELAVRAPADWQVVSNMAADTTASAWVLALSADAAGADLHHRGRGRPVPRGAQRARRHPARHLLPRIAGRLPGCRRDLRGDQAGSRLLPAGVRQAVPVRQVRPALRARIQGRRDGERRRRDVRGELHLPVPGHRLRPRGPGRDHPARDGAHVVRRPGHHALVGRPVAERVVRHLGGHAGPGRGHPLVIGVDHVRAAVQGLGVPAGPAAVHAPDRGRHSRHPRGRGELRRHHLRQGRGRAQAAGRLRRPGQLPGRAAPLLRRSRLGQRHAARPARGARGNLRPGSVRVVEAVAGDRGRQHAAPRLPDRPGRHDHPLRGPAGGAGQPPGAAHAPDRGRAVRPHRIGPRLAGPAAPGGGRRGRRADRGARAGRRAPSGPGAGQRRRPHLRQDPAGRPLAAHPHRRHRRVRRLAARRAVLGGGLGHVPGRRDGRARLPAAGAVRHRVRSGHIRGADAAAAGHRGGAQVRRSGLAPDRAEPAGRHAPRTAGPGRARARTRSWPTCRRSPARPSRGGTRTCCAGCWTAPS